MKSIKQIVDEYNKGRLPDENPISNNAIANATLFQDTLKTNGITGYTVVPSSFGTIYFEWDTKDYTLGVAFGDDNKINLEHTVKEPFEFFLERYDLNDENVPEQLIELIKDIVK